MKQILAYAVCLIVPTAGIIHSSGSSSKQTPLLSRGRKDDFPVAAASAAVSVVTSRNGTRAVVNVTGGLREQSTAAANSSAAKIVDKTVVNGSAGLSEEGLAAFCFLKRKLMDLYALRPLPKQLREGRASCAVVSSSGALLHNAHGPDIDKHDVVFRFNSAPIEGYQMQVGKFTTFRLGWSFPGDGVPTLKPNFNQEDPGYMQLHRLALRKLYPDEPQLGKTEDPTSGFYGMLLAFANCGSIDAYEMAPSVVAEVSAYNYYSPPGRWSSKPGGALQNGWHGLIAAEHDLWRLLSINSKKERDIWGKSTHPCFHCVTCPAEGSSMLMNLSPGLEANLTMLVKAILPEPEPLSSGNASALFLIPES